MTNDNVYRKVGRKYEPIGVFYHRDWLTDGIWYVRSKGCRITNGDYIQQMFKVCDKPLFEDFSKYCDLEDIAETILTDKDFTKSLNTKNGWSISDIVHITLAVLEKKRKEQNGETTG